MQMSVRKSVCVYQVLSGHRTQDQVELLRQYYYVHF